MRITSVLVFVLLCKLSLAQINLSQGLVAYYPFNGNANDASGNGFHGTLRNGVQITSDRFGNPNQAYFFDGQDDYIEINDNGGLSPNEVSVVAMINTEISTAQAIVGKIEYTTGYAGTYFLGINYDVQAGYFFGTTPYSATCFQQYPYDPSNPFARSTQNFTTNQWHCLVGTFKDSVLRIYIDGVLADEKRTNYNDLIQCNNTQLLIGSWWAGDNVKFRGKIDEVRIYNRALNASEVGALCNIQANLCTGSLGDPVVNINFGQGSNPAPALPAIVPGASTSLNFVAVNGNPATPTPFDGDYTITNNVPSNAAWHTGMLDHTPNDNNGFMAFYNSQETAGLEFYRQRVDNLCGSTTYEFAAWIANCVNPSLLNGVDPDITFVIERPDGTVLSTYTTGAIPENNVFTWKQYGFFFTLPAGETSIVLKMINNSVGGNAQPGNDLAIDDITFRPCGPNAKASFNAVSQIDSLTVCAGDPVAVFGALGTGYTSPNYLWQFSTDNGATWTDIVPASSLNYNFTAPLIGTRRTYLYRMVAGDGGNFNSPNCRVSTNRLALTIIPRSICSVKGTPISGVINKYTEVLGLDKCTNTLTVSDASEFNVGDTVIIIQMKGAAIDLSNSGSFGSVSSLNSAGNYEYNYISQKNGNRLDLRNLIQRTYEVPNGVVQLVRVPYYTTATVVDTLTSLPWNGRIGGILAFEVRDTLHLGASVDVSGKGFRGGRAANSRQLVTNCSENQFFYPDGDLRSAAKGESVVVLASQFSEGKGSPASGGGGGLDHNSGGGGGANGGAGGFGGYQLEACSGAAFDNRGIGGKSIPYSNIENKIFLGGGGGAGHSNQPSGIETDGGNGGGIIILKTRVVDGFGNFISVAGKDVVNCELPNLDNCHDASGGGGGGGALLIETSSFSSFTDLVSVGGKGGDLVVFNNVGGGRIGPGGGGGAGVVWLNAATLPAFAQITNYGGQSGVIKQDANNPWGSTAGQPGISLFGLILPIDNTLFVKNINSIQLTSNLVACKNIRFDGNVQTNISPIVNYKWDFGDGVVINSQTPSITHAYANGGNYNTKLVVSDQNGCSDSLIIPVQVDTVEALVTVPPVTCINQPVTLLGSGGTSFSWSPGQYLSDPTIANPVAIVSTTTRFVLTVSNNSLCSDTASVLVEVRPRPLFVAPISTVNVCANDTVELRGNNGANVNYEWSPATFLDNPTSQNPISIPLNSIVYTVRISEPVCNYDSNFTVNLTVRPSPLVEASRTRDIDCSNPTSQLLATGAVSYTWTPSTGLNNPTIPNPISTTTTNTTYTVIGLDANGCSNTDTVLVKVTNGGTVNFVLPNAFTPNGDGKNDCFGIQKWGGVTIQEFSVFNRWGQKVFTTKNPSVCWDGRFNGKMQEVGGYVYVIRASSFCGEIKKTGNLLLIR